MAETIGYRFSAEAHEVFREYLRLRIEQPWFANARSVRNALERARLRHARRLLAEPGEVTLAELSTIEPEDLLVSRVFQQGLGDQAALP